MFRWNPRGGVVYSAHLLLCLAAFGLKANADGIEPSVREVPPNTDAGDIASTESKSPAQRDNSEYVEEVVVIGEQQTPYFVMDPVTIQRIRDDHGKGSRLYRQKRYEEAYPYLINAARSGFKLSQARVGFMYHKGLGGINRDGVAAIGWIGVAASGTTSPEIRDYFKAIMRQVPEEHLETVRQIVAQYEHDFGSDATGVTCDNTRMAGFHASRLKCDHEDEYRRDTIDDSALSERFG